MTLLAAANAAAWLVLITLSCVVLALTRQVGILHERLSPLGPTPTLTIGASLPLLTATDTTGTTHNLGGPRHRPQLLLFTAPRCPACATLAPAAPGLCAAHNTDLALLPEGPTARLVAAGRTPYALLLDTSGTIRARATVDAPALAAMLATLSPSEARHAA